MFTGKCGSVVVGTPVDRRFTFLPPNTNAYHNLLCTCGTPPAAKYFKLGVLENYRARDTESCVAGNMFQQRRVIFLEKFKINIPKKHYPRMFNTVMYTTVPAGALYS